MAYKFLDKVNSPKDIKNFSIDELYYVAKRRFHMSDADFWASSYKKMKFLLDKLNEELDVQSSNSEVQYQQNITSMKQISGWING